MNKISMKIPSGRCGKFKEIPFTPRIFKSCRLKKIPQKNIIFWYHTYGTRYSNNSSSPEYTYVVLVRYNDQ